MTPHEKALEAATLEIGDQRLARVAISAYRAAMRAEGFRQVKVPHTTNLMLGAYANGWDDAVATTLATEITP